MNPEGMLVTFVVFLRNAHCKPSDVACKVLNTVNKSYTNRDNPCNISWENLKGFHPFRLPNFKTNDINDFIA